MKIDSDDLPVMVVNGVKAAYLADHKDSTDDAFHRWVVKQAEYSLGFSTALLAQCTKALNGQTARHYADLPPRDQRAIIAARRAIEGFTQLEGLAADILA